MSVVGAMLPRLRELEDRRRGEAAAAAARESAPLTDAQVARVAALLSLASAAKHEAVAS